VESSALAGWHEGVIWPACRRARQRRQPVSYRREGWSVLACAPAGSGKTVLLAAWARRGTAPVSEPVAPSCQSPAAEDST